MAQDWFTEHAPKPSAPTPAPNWFTAHAPPSPGARPTPSVSTPVLPQTRRFHESFEANRPTPAVGTSGVSLSRDPSSIRARADEFQVANERQFRDWYAGHAKRWDLNPDPDDPRQFYDYRAAFKADVEPDETGHWPSDFKKPGHPSLIVGGIDTRTGVRVPGVAQADERDLVAKGWAPETAARLSSTTDLLKPGAITIAPETRRQLEQLPLSVAKPPTPTSDREEPKIGPDPAKAGPLGLADFFRSLVTTDDGARLSKKGEALIPFVGPVAQAADAYNVIRAARRIRDDEDTPADRQLLEDYQARDAEAQTRGTSLLHDIANVAAQIPGFAVEFAATSGTFAGARKLVTEALEKIGTAKATQLAAKGAGAVAGAVAQTAALPQRVVAEATRRQAPTPQDLETELADWNDDFLPALAKAIPDQFVEIFSERTGGVLEGPLAALTKLPLAQRAVALKKAVFGRWLTLNPNGTVQDFLAKVRSGTAWNGVIGEMFEERVGEVMRAAQPYLREPEQPPPPMIRAVTGEPTAETKPDEDTRVQALREFGRQLVTEAAAFTVPGAIGSALAYLPSGGTPPSAPPLVEPPRPPIEPSVSPVDLATARQTLPVDLRQPGEGVPLPVVSPVPIGPQLPAVDLPADQAARNALARAEAAAEPRIAAMGTAREVVPGADTPKPREFSSTQVNLPPGPIQDTILNLAATIPDEALAPDGRAGQTPDTMPHVTVKFGIHAADAEAVRELLKDEPPITLTLGKTSFFPNSESENGDVLKVDVDSVDLRRLNTKISEALEVTDTHPTYQPHVTIAYLKAGLGQQYADDDVLEGQTLTLDRIVFSSKDGTTTEIPLTGPKETPDAEVEARVRAGALRDVETPPTAAVAASTAEDATPAQETAVAAPEGPQRRLLRVDTVTGQAVDVEALDAPLGRKDVLVERLLSGEHKILRAGDQVTPTGRSRIAKADFTLPEASEVGGFGETVSTPQILVSGPQVQVPDTKTGAKQPITTETPSPIPSITYNAERKSVEVKWQTAPERQVLDKLKAAGFRWSKGNKVWYRRTDKAAAAAEQDARTLLGQAEPTPAPPVSKNTEYQNLLRQAKDLAENSGIPELKAGGVNDKGVTFNFIGSAAGGGASFASTIFDLRDFKADPEVAIRWGREKQAQNAGRHAVAQKPTADMTDDELVAAAMAEVEAEQAVAPSGPPTITSRRGDNVPGESAPVRPAREGSPYAGEDLDQLEPQVVDEQKGRWFGIQNLREAVAQPNARAKKGTHERLTKELKDLERVYEATYQEWDAAGGDMDDLRDRVEDAPDNEDWFYTAAQAGFPHTKAEDLIDFTPDLAWVRKQTTPIVKGLLRAYEDVEGEIDEKHARFVRVLERDMLRREGQGDLFVEPVVATALSEAQNRVGEAQDRPTEVPRADRPLASGEAVPAPLERPGHRRPPATSRPPGARVSPEAGPEPRPSAGTRAGGTISTAPGTRGTTDPALSTGFYRITDADRIGTGTVRERIARNFAAIRIVKDLAKEQRPATREEQAILVQYVGWGGLSRVFEPWKYDLEGKRDNDYWRAQHETLQGLLTTDEYARARNSTQNAHYTSAPVIRAMWDAVRRLGVRTGSVLEPSAGIGHFLGLAPADLRLNWATVEKDPLTAQIAAALYPGVYGQATGFEDAQLPLNHFAVAVSNVPFGAIPITDAAFRGPAFIRRRIHNYFFAKALDHVAPGGLVAFISTHGTLDSRDNTAVRAFLASRADFLGAIRLPYTAFLENAGTEVVTDIVFLRRRHDGAPIAHVAPWTQTTEVEFPNKDGPLFKQWVNEYFLAHPEMVLGRHMSTGKMRQANTYNVEPVGDLPALMQAAIARLPVDAINLQPPAETLQAFQQTQPPLGSRPFEYLIHEGRLAQVIDGVVQPTEMTKADEDRIRGLLPIREALRDLYDRMATDASDADVATAQKALVKAYDRFVKRHGFVSSEANWSAFHEDPDLPLLLSLEDYDAEHETATKMAIFTTRTLRAMRAAQTADTPVQALQIALGETGTVDLARIGSLLQVTPEDAAAQLQATGLIVDTPSGWELPARYLSGNVRVKLVEAQAAAQLDARYQGAVDRLTATLPEDIPSYKINVRLGASWIPVEYVREFVRFVTNARGELHWGLAYTSLDAKWSIEGPPGMYHSAYETPDVDTKTMLLAALNDKRITVRKPVQGGGSVVDPQATALARQRREELYQAFATWLFNENPTRRDWAVRTYNDRFNAHVAPNVEGSYLQLPGMAQYWKERIDPHQRNAVARILQFGNTLLAHVVGSGKTLSMVAAGMEMRRLGLARKPIYVVPNHLIAQWPSEFLQYYPNAKIFVTRPEDLEKENRRRFTARIAAGDWDAVIMPYSSFVRVSMSAEAEGAYHRDILDEIETAILEAWEAERRVGNTINPKRPPPSIKQLENMRDRIQNRLDRLGERPKDDMLTFEQLGVDAIFYDEAHALKNLYFHTRQQAAGIPSENDAQRATDMYLKSRYINQLTKNRNIVFATGTPVSNSMAEVFVMQKFLQEDVLERAGIATFDAWLGQFGLITVETELDPSGTGMSARPRLAKFRNLPDLASLFRQVADVQMIDDLPALKAARPKLRGDGQEIVEIPMTTAQRDFLRVLKDRADHLDPRDRRTDNMAKITVDGRLSALDMRLLDRRHPDDPGSKLHKVVEHVASIWAETATVKGTQLVFLDSGTPGSEERSQKPRKYVDDHGNVLTRPPTEAERHRGFNLYADIKRKLVAQGVPASQIAFIHDIDALPPKKRDGARKALFRRVREGQVRVLVGSSVKMGTGMNVQDRLVALHNVDPTYKPSETEQRNGRILRQGNLLAKADPAFRIRIMNYITRGVESQFGFDAYMWQLNEAKAKIIADFFKGKITDRDLSLDLEQTVLSAGQFKAVATGNPLVIELNKAEAEAERLEWVRAGWQEERQRAAWTRGEVQATMARLVQDQERAKRTAEAVEAYEEGTLLTAMISGEALEGHKKIGEAVLQAAQQATTADEGHPGRWRTYDSAKQIGTLRGLAAWIEGNGTQDPHLVLRHPDDVPPRYGHVEASTDYQTVLVALVHASTAETAVGGLTWRDPTALVRMANDRVTDVGRSLGMAATSLLNEKQGELQRIDQILTNPFPQQALYDGAVAKRDELRRSLGIGQEEVVEAADQGSGEEDEGLGATADALPADTAPIVTVPSGPGLTTKLSLRQRLAIRPDQIVQGLAEAIGNVPLAVGKTRGNLGLFKWEGVVRSKVAGDWRTQLHELGHAIDKLVEPFSARYTRDEIAKELKALGEATSKPSYDAAQRRREGVAEYIRRWIMEPETVRAEAPMFTRAFETFIANRTHPVGAALADAQGKMHTYLQLTPGEQFDLMVDYGDGRWPDWAERSVGWGLGTYQDPRTGWDRLVAGLSDDKHRLWEIERELKEGILDPGLSAYWLMRLLPGAVRRAEGFIHYGVRDAAGKILGPGLDAALHPHLPKYRDIVNYMVAQRAQRARARGLTTGFTPAQIKAKLEQGQDDPDVVTAAAGIAAFRKGFLDYLETEGFLPAKTRSAWERAWGDTYVPFKRTSQAIARSIGAGARPMARRPRFFRRFIGSAEPIVDPIVTLIEDVYAGVSTALENKLMREILALSRQPESGQFLEILEPQKVPITFNLQAVKEAVLEELDDAGVEVADSVRLDEAFLDQLVTIWTPQKFSVGSKHYVTVLNPDGSRTWAQIHDEGLWDLIDRHNAQTTSAMIKVFRFFARPVRATATLNLPWMLRNIGRDFFQATIYSPEVFTPAATIRGLKSVLNEDEDWQLYLHSLAGQATFSAQDRDVYKRELRRYGATRVRRFLAMKVFHPFDMLLALRELSEQATRVGASRLQLEAERKSDEGLTEAGMRRAGIIGREVTQDFQKIGAWVRDWNKASAFLAARIGGYTRATEQVKAHPAQTGRRLVPYVAFVLALWLLNRGDDEYDALPSDEKALWHHVRIPQALRDQGWGPFLQLPRPFEWGDLSNILEGFLDWQVDRDPQFAKRLPTADWGLLGEMILGIAPDAFLPTLEITANYDTFRNRALISPWDIGQDPDLQYNRWTSETAKGIGRILGVPPIYIDHLLSSYFTGLYRFGTVITDRALSDVGVIPPAPEGIAGLPSAVMEGLAHEARRAFYAGERVGMADLDQFYKELERLEGAVSSVYRYRNAGDMEKARERAAADGLGFTLRGNELVVTSGRLQALRAGRTAMQAQRAEMDRIYLDRAMSPSEKREALNRVTETLVNIARQRLGKPMLSRTERREPPSPE